jgi:NitT/TauT family transport system substrate-binding protein
MNLSPVSFRRLAAVVACGLLPALGAAAAPTTVRLSAIDRLLTDLGTGLGYFEREGIAVEVVKVEAVSPEDYLMQEPLVNGRLDASYHWFHHVVFGHRHNLPLKAVLKVCDSPGMKVLVANRVKDQVKSGADFKGRNIAEGAGYATKSTLMNLLARQGGLTDTSYTPVNQEVDGRLENILKGLKDGRVDIMAFMEPMTTSLEASGQVSVLYDLTNRAGTVRALGHEWLAQSVFVSDNFIAAHPDTVQRLVNAYVRTLRYVNAHTAEEIAAQLPAAYFAGKDRATEVTRIRKFLTNVARDDYSFPADAAQFALDTLIASKFDESDEGRFRRTGDRKITADSLYTNRFVEKAMKEIK